MAKKPNERCIQLKGDRQVSLWKTRGGRYVIEFQRPAREDDKKSGKLVGPTRVLMEDGKILATGVNLSEDAACALRNLLLELVPLRGSLSTYDL
jgi:hypothetical protein